MGRVLGKVAIVTGAASGMGRAIALMLKEEGAKVIATDINEKLLNTLTEENTEGEAGEIFTIIHDVSSQEDSENVVKKAIEKYGKIDILVNNAGISLATPFEQLTNDDWNRVMSINVSSIFYLCQFVLPHMQKNKGGSIINISSMASLVGNSGSGPYTASKGAVRSLSKALAVDYAKDKIRVNTIHPGYIETAMTEELFKNELYRGMFTANTPLPYLGDAQDIAFATVFLASDESKFITGVDLPIDGGVVAR